MKITRKLIRSMEREHQVKGGVFYTIGFRTRIFRESTGELEKIDAIPRNTVLFSLDSQLYFVDFGNNTPRHLLLKCLLEENVCYARLGSENAAPWRNLTELKEVKE